MGNITVDIQARVVGYQASLKEFQNAFAKVDPGSTIGKKLSTALEVAKKQVADLGRNMFPKASSDTQIDAIAEKVNRVGAALQGVSDLFQGLNIGDLNFKALSPEISAASRELEQLQAVVDNTMNKGIQEAIANSAQLSTAFKGLGADLKSITADNGGDILAKGLANAEQEAEKASKAYDKVLSRAEAAQRKLNNIYANPYSSKNFNQEEVMGKLLGFDDPNRVINVDKIKEIQDKVQEVLNSFKGKGSENANAAQELINNFFGEINPDITIDQFRTKFEDLCNQLKSQGFTTQGITRILGSSKADNIFNEILNLDAASEETKNKLTTLMEGLFDTLNFDNKQKKVIKNLIDKDQFTAAVEEAKRIIEEGYKKINDAEKAAIETNNNLAGKLEAAKGVKVTAEAKRDALSGAQTNYNQIESELRAKVQTQENRITVLENTIQQLTKGELGKILSNTAGAGRHAGGQAFPISEAQAYGKELEKINSAQQFVGKLQGVTQRWFSVYAVVRMVSNAIKTIISNTKELDKTITEIAIVTNKSQDQLWAQMPDYTQMAKKYGASISGAYKVSQLYYQQGLGQEDVMALSEETLKMARISGLDYAEATDYMTNAVRSFKLEMTEASTVVDTYSAVAASSATSVTELATAMSKTASSAQAVGASLQNTTAMMAVMIEATRESPENIGSAMKSIISRYGELKENKVGTDTEGEEYSLNKVDTALQSVGISIHDAKGEFRDFDDVIMELSEHWNTIDKNTQRYIATVMAGNRQQSRFLALVSSGERLKELSSIAADSEDASQAQYLKTLDSIEYKAQQMKTSLQSLYQDEGVQDLIKDTLDAITNIIDSFNRLSSAFNTPIAAIAKFGVQFANIARIVTTTFGLIKTGVAAQIDAIRSSSITKAQQAATKEIEIEKTKNEQILVSRLNLARETQYNMLTAQGKSPEEASLILQNMGLGPFALGGRISTGSTNKPGIFQNGGLFGKGSRSLALTGLGLSIAGSALSMKAMSMGEDTQDERNEKGNLTLASSILTGAGMGAMFGPWGAAAGAAVGLITGIIESESIKFEDAAERAERLSKELDEAKNENISKKNEYKSLQSTISEYEQLRQKHLDSAEAAQEYIDKCNEIAEEHPDLIQGYDAEGNAIVNLTQAYRELALAKEGVSESEKKEAETSINEAANARKEAENKVAEAHEAEIFSSIGEEADKAKADLAKQVYDLQTGGELVGEVVSSDYARVNALLQSTSEGSIADINQYADIIERYSNLQRVFGRYLTATQARVEGKDLVGEAERAENRAKSKEKATYITGAKSVVDSEIQELLLSDQINNSSTYKYLSDFQNASIIMSREIAARAQKFKDEFGEEKNYYYGEGNKFDTDFEEINSAIENFMISALQRQKDQLNDLIVNQGNYTKNEAKDILESLGLDDENPIYTSIMSYYTDTLTSVDDIIELTFEAKGKRDKSGKIGAKLREDTNRIKDREALTSELLDNIATEEGIEAAVDAVIEQQESASFLHALGDKEKQAVASFYNKLLDKVDNASLTENSAEAAMDVYIDVWKAVTDSTNTLFSGITGQQLQQDLQELVRTSDFSTAEGIQQFKDGLADLGVTLDQLRLEADQFDIQIPPNFSAKIQTYADTMSTQLTDFEKDLKSASSGMDFSKAMTMAQTLGIKISEFRQKGDKFFLDDYTLLEQYYFEEHEKRIQELKDEQAEELALIEKYDLKQQGNKISVQDVIDDQNNIYNTEAKKISAINEIFSDDTYRTALSDQGFNVDVLKQHLIDFIKNGDGTETFAEYMKNNFEEQYASYVTASEEVWKSSTATSQLKSGNIEGFLRTTGAWHNIDEQVLEGATKRLNEAQESNALLMQGYLSEADDIITERQDVYNKALEQKKLQLQIKKRALEQSYKSSIPDLDNIKQNLLETKYAGLVSEQDLNDQIPLIKEQLLQEQDYKDEINQDDFRQSAILAVVEDLSLFNEQLHKRRSDMYEWLMQQYNSEGTIIQSQLEDLTLDDSNLIKLGYKDIDDIKIEDFEDQAQEIVESRINDGIQMSEEQKLQQIHNEQEYLYNQAIATTIENNNAIIDSLYEYTKDNLLDLAKQLGYVNVMSTDDFNVAFDNAWNKEYELINKEDLIEQILSGYYDEFLPQQDKEIIDKEQLNQYNEALTKNWSILDQVSHQVYSEALKTLGAVGTYTEEELDADAQQIYETAVEANNEILKNLQQLDDIDTLAKESLASKGIIDYSGDVLEQERERLAREIAEKGGLLLSEDIEYYKELERQTLEAEQAVVDEINAQLKSAIASGDIEYIRAFDEEYGTKLSEYEQVIFSLYHSVNSSIADAMIKAVGGETSYLSVTETNADALKLLQQDHPDWITGDIEDGKIVKINAEKLAQDSNAFIQYVAESFETTDEQIKAISQYHTNKYSKNRTSSLEAVIDKSVFSYEELLNYLNRNKGIETDNMDDSQVAEKAKEMGLAINSVGDVIVDDYDAWIKDLEDSVRMLPANASQAEVNAAKTKLAQAKIQQAEAQQKALSDISSNWNKVTLTQREALANSLQVNVTTLAKYFTDNADKTTATFDFGAFIRDVEAGKIKLADGVQETLDQSTTELIDEYSKNIQTAMSLVTKGTTNQKDIENFKTLYESITQETLDSTAFVYDDLLSAFILKPEYIQVIIDKQKEALSGLGFSGTDIDKYINDQTIKVAAAAIDINSFINAENNKSGSLASRNLQVQLTNFQGLIAKKNEETSHYYDTAFDQLASENPHEMVTNDMVKARASILANEAKQFNEKWAEFQGLTVDGMISTFREGGDTAVKLGQAIAEAAGKELTAEEMQKYYAPMVAKYVGMAEQVANLVGGQFVGAGDFRDILVSAKIVDASTGLVNNVFEMADAYKAIYDKLALNLKSTTSQLNTVYAQYLTASESKEVDAISALGDAMGMTYDTLGTMLAKYGITLKQAMDNSESFGFEKIGNGKIRINNFEQFAASVGISGDSEEYVSAFKAYNDSLIELNKNAKEKIYNEVSAITSAKAGDWINLTELSNTLEQVAVEPIIKTVTESGQYQGLSHLEAIPQTALDQLNAKLALHGGQIVNGVLKLYDGIETNIAAILEDILSYDELGIGEEQKAQLKDAVDGLMTNIVNTINNGAKGSMSNTDMFNLTNWYRQQTGDSEAQLDFTQTQDGLQLTTSSLLNLYDEVSKVSAFSAMKLLPDLQNTSTAYSSLQKALKEYEEAQNQAANSARARAAANIAGGYLDNPDSYSNYWQSPLTTAEQSFANVMPSIISGKKVFDNAAKKGYMGYEDALSMARFALQDDPQKMAQLVDIINNNAYTDEKSGENRINVDAFKDLIALKDLRIAWENETKEFLEIAAERQKAALDLEQSGKELKNINLSDIFSGDNWKLDKLLELAPHLEEALKNISVVIDGAETNLFEALQGRSDVFGADFWTTFLGNMADTEWTQENILEQMMNALNINDITQDVNGNLKINVKLDKNGKPVVTFDGDPIDSAEYQKWLQEMIASQTVIKGGSTGDKPLIMEIGGASYEVVIDNYKIQSIKGPDNKELDSGDVIWQQLQKELKKDEFQTKLTDQLTKDNILDVEIKGDQVKVKFVNGKGLEEGLEYDNFNELDESVQKLLTGKIAENTLTVNVDEQSQANLDNVQAQLASIEGTHNIILNVQQIMPENTDLSVEGITVKPSAITVDSSNSSGTVSGAINVDSATITASDLTLNNEGEKSSLVGDLTAVISNYTDTDNPNKLVSELQAVINHYIDTDNPNTLVSELQAIISNYTNAGDPNKLVNALQAVISHYTDTDDPDALVNDLWAIITNYDNTEDPEELVEDLNAVISNYDDIDDPNSLVNALKAIIIKYNSNDDPNKLVSTLIAWISEYREGPNAQPPTLDDLVQFINQINTDGADAALAAWRTQQESKTIDITVKLQTEKNPWDDVEIIKDGDVVRFKYPEQQEQKITNILPPDEVTIPAKLDTEDAEQQIDSLDDDPIHLSTDDTASSIITDIKSALDNLVQSPYKVNIEANITGSTGGAGAKGNVALAGGTLMGELGPELVVSNGHYYVVGQNGAEMVDLPRDAIVFNHIKTKQLLNNGSTGRGKSVTNDMVAAGEAHAMTAAKYKQANIDPLVSTIQTLQNAINRIDDKLKSGSGTAADASQRAEYANTIKIGQAQLKENTYHYNAMLKAEQEIAESRSKTADKEKETADKLKDSADKLGDAADKTEKANGKSKEKDKAEKNNKLHTGYVRYESTASTSKTKHNKKTKTYVGTSGVASEHAFERIAPSNTGVTGSQSGTLTTKQQSAVKTAITELISQGLETINFDADTFKDLNADIKAEMKAFVAKADATYLGFFKKYREYLDMSVSEYNQTYFDAWQKDLENEGLSESILSAASNLTFFSNGAAAGSKDDWVKLFGDYTKVDDLVEKGLIKWNDKLKKYVVTSIEELAKLDTHLDIEPLKSIIADSIRSTFKTISDYLAEGLKGSLSNVNFDTLSAMLEENGLGKITTDMTTETGQGLKLTMEAIASIYDKLKEVNSLQASITLETLMENLKETNDDYKTSSSLLAHIQELTEKIADTSKYSDAKIKQYKEELALAQDILAVRATSKDDSFSFLSQDIPDAMNNPLNYVNDWITAYRAFDDSVKNDSAMSFQTFYNTIKEVNAQAKATGQSISMLGVELDGTTEGMNKLITAAAKSLGTDKSGNFGVIFSKMAASLGTGISDFTTATDTAMNDMADAQIKILDGLIAMFEVIVAMQNFESVDKNKNSFLDLDEIFDLSGITKKNDKTVTTFTKEYQAAAQKIIDQSKTDADLESALKSVKYGDYTMYQLIQDAINGKKQLELGYEQYKAVVSALYNAYQSGDYSQQNIYASLKSTLAGSKEKLNEIFTIGDTFLSFKFGSAITVEKATDSAGKTKYKTSSGAEYDTVEQAVEAAALEAAGVDTSNKKTPIKFNSDGTATGTIKVGTTTITVSTKKDGGYEYTFAGGGTYDSAEEAYRALYHKETKKNADVDIIDYETWKVQKGLTIVTKLQDVDKSNLSSSQIDNLVGKTYEEVKAEWNDLVNKKGEAGKTEFRLKYGFVFEEDSSSDDFSALKDSLVKHEAMELTLKLNIVNLQDIADVFRGVKTQAQIEEDEAARIAKAKASSLITAVTEEPPKPTKKNGGKGGKSDEGDTGGSSGADISSLTMISEALKQQKTYQEEAGESIEVTDKLSDTKIETDASRGKASVEGLSKAEDEAQRGADKLSGTDIDPKTSGVSDINSLSEALYDTYKNAKKLREEAAKGTIEISVSTGEDSGSDKKSSGGNNTVADAKGTVGRALAGGTETLMGELGPELYVSNGRYHIAGQNGAEFVNLPKDAIVFNHLQTRKLLQSGMAGRGKPITNETNAIAMARGTSGVAMASASEILAILKQLKSMWESLRSQSLKNLAALGTSGGDNSSGSADPQQIAAYIKEVERWYNLLQKIAQLEKDINREEKIRAYYASDRVERGEETFESKMRQLANDQTLASSNMELANSKEDYLHGLIQRYKDEDAPVFRFYDIDDRGQPYLKENGLKLLEEVMHQDDYGKTLTPEEQFNKLGLNQEIIDSLKLKNDSGELINQDWYNKKAQEKLQSQLTNEDKQALTQASSQGMQDALSSRLTTIGSEYDLYGSAQKFTGVDGTEYYKYTGRDGSVSYSKVNGTTVYGYDQNNNLIQTPMSSSISAEDFTKAAVASGIITDAELQEAGNKATEAERQSLFAKYSKEGLELNPEDYDNKDQYYRDAVEAYLQRADDQKDQIQTLHDEIMEAQDKAIEVATDANEILNSLEENQKEVEKKVYDALVNSREKEIETMTKERKALSDAAEGYISGLTDAMNRERSLYDNQKGNSELTTLRRQLDILQRSGGSASQIASLQKQIAEQEKNMYFETQQALIDEVKKSSDLELEKLQAQIDLSTELLNFEKEHGLLWERVSEIMQGSKDSIISFVTGEDKSWATNSPLTKSNDLVTLGTKVGEFTAFRDNLDPKKQNSGTFPDLKKALEDGFGTVVTDLGKVVPNVKSPGGNTGEPPTKTSEPPTTTSEPPTKTSEPPKTSEPAKVTETKKEEKKSTNDISDQMKKSNPVYNGWNVPQDQWNKMTWQEQNEYNRMMAEQALSGEPQWVTSGGQNMYYIDANGKTVYSQAGLLAASVYGDKNDKYKITQADIDKGKYNSYLASEYQSSAAISAVTAAGGSNSAEMLRMPDGTIVLKPTSHALGGDVTTTGLVMMHGTPANPETVLSANATKQWKAEITGKQNSSLINRLVALSEVLNGIENVKTGNISGDSGIIIENASVNMYVEEIANDYDARRAGEQALEEMLKIARKSGANSVRR